MYLAGGQTGTCLVSSTDGGVGVLETGSSRVAVKYDRVERVMGGLG